MIKYIYGAGIWCYRQGVRLAAAAGNRKASLLNAGLKATFRHLRDSLTPGARYIWIHAASLGEFEQGRPLMERLRRLHPEFKILLTFFSPSGYEVRKNYAGADIVAYLPFDTPLNPARFLSMVKPEMAIFVKYEFWLNYLAELKRRGIPTYLISGIFRPNQLFFKPYGGIYRRCLKCFRRLYLQDHGSRHLLEGIGIGDVVVAGDTRFDRVTDICRTVKPHPLLDRFCGTKAERSATPVGSRPLIFMAGSSWPEDEEVYAPWLIRTQGVKGVIAPHEFDAPRLKRLLALFGDEAILLSEAEKNPDLMKGKRILIIDCFGLLSSAYTYADLAYVGGGFGAGLHNINEAAVYGIPVIYGPNHSKFIEAEEMKTLGGGIAITGRTAFERNADIMLYDSVRRAERGKWAGEYIASKIGATDIICHDLFGDPMP